jgi:hypothetical protein
MAMMSMKMRTAFVASLLLLSCVRNTATPEEVRTFTDAVRTERPLPEAFARARRAEGPGVRMWLRSTDMPTGHREWITASFAGSAGEIERTLVAQLGPARGRGFGNEPGWLLPHGAIILEKFADRADITFSPGDPLDALEDLDKPHLPSTMPGEEAILRDGFVIGVRLRSAADLARFGLGDVRAAPCAAKGNYFVVREADGVTVWRRPLAQWNVDVQRQCAKNPRPA